MDFIDKGLCSVENDPYTRVVGNGEVKHQIKQRNSRSTINTKMCVNGASREKRVFAIICVLVGSRLLAGNTKKTMPVSSFLTTYMARSWLKKNNGSIFPFMTLCGEFVEHHKVPSGVHRNGNMMAFFLCFNILSLYQLEHQYFDARL